MGVWIIISEIEMYKPYGKFVFLQAEIRLDKPILHIRHD